MEQQYKELSRFQPQQEQSKQSEQQQRFPGIQVLFSPVFFLFTEEKSEQLISPRLLPVLAFAKRTSETSNTIGRQSKMVLCFFVAPTYPARFLTSVTRVNPRSLGNEQDIFRRR
ncbi:MAG: hypothetical protein HC892_20670 [Saprospiraceae bacterium]|nr:hypothetical protein [Saprospiraceae bacterium]